MTGAVAAQAPDMACPRRDLGGAIANPAAAAVHPEIAPVRGQPELAGQVHPDGDAERNVAALQQVEDIAVEPARMAKLDREAQPAAPPQHRQEVVEPGQVQRQVRRQLEEDRAQLVAQAAGALQQSGNRLLRLAQPLEVGEEAAPLDGEQESLRRPVPPGAEASAVRQPVERVVQLYRGKLRGVELELPVRR